MRCARCMLAGWFSTPFPSVAWRSSNSAIFSFLLSRKTICDVRRMREPRAANGVCLIASRNRNLCWRCQCAPMCSLMGEMCASEPKTAKRSSSLFNAFDSIVANASMPWQLILIPIQLMRTAEHMPRVARNAHFVHVSAWNKRKKRNKKIQND